MLSSQELDKLRAENPAGIVHLVAKDGKWEAVFKAPNRAQYKMFRANNHNQARVADANEILARQICIFPPTPEAFEALLDKFPAIPEALAQDEEFRAMLGISTDEGAKK